MVTVSLVIINKVVAGIVVKVTPFNGNLAQQAAEATIRNEG